MMMKKDNMPTNWQTLLEEYSKEGCAFNCYLCRTRKTKLYEYFENKARGLAAKDFVIVLEEFEEFIKKIFIKYFQL